MKSKTYRKVRESLEKALASLERDDYGQTFDELGEARYLLSLRLKVEEAQSRLNAAEEVSNGSVL